MSQQLDKLKQQPVNKTVVFWSPIEGDDVLVRTGTIGEGSCCYHALLHAYSKEYASMDRHGRMKFVSRLRAGMASAVDRESWEDMGNGLISKIPFQENVNNILVNFYRFLGNDKNARGRSTRRVIKNLVGEDASELELYSIVTELIPFDTGFEQIILPEAYSNSEDGKIAECCDAIIEATLKFLNKNEEFKSIPVEKSTYISNTVRKFLTIILKEAEDSAYKNYVTGLQNVSEEVDGYTIGLISERFKRDIYFLDSKTRMPYNNASTTENLKNRKSIIVLWIGGNHYEIVGRLLPGNRIQREFQPDDPLITKFYTFLVKPEEIGQKFPELNPYIPRKHRNTNSPSPRRFTDTEDDEEQDSDRYYDSSDHDSDYESNP